jgi:hypothetical protein
MAVIAAGLLGTTSCTSMTRGSESNSYLIIDRLAAAAGGFDEDEETSLQSDVLTKGSVFEDVGLVTFRLALKDPGVPTVPNVMTTNNFITVNRYRVTYSRADGRNTPGVDVPHPFDGAFTVTVRAEGTAEATFPIVRVQAKAEPPLRNLIGNFGQGVISVIADVTFYGYDQTGRAVSVAGKISIDFADWGDPD